MTHELGTVLVEDTLAVHLKAEAWERAGTALLNAPFDVPLAKLGSLYADLRKAEDELTTAVRHARQHTEAQA